MFKHIHLVTYMYMKLYIL